MKRFSFALTLALAWTGCTKEDDKDESSDGTITEGSGALPVSDLQAPTDLPALTRTEISAYLLNNQADFLATEAEDEATAENEGTEGEGADCFTSSFEKVTVSATGDTATINVSFDLRSCLQEFWKTETEGVTAELSKANMSIYMVNTCVGDDLSSLNGKKLSELGDLADCAESRMLMNMKSEMAGKLSIDGQTFDVNTTNVSGLGTASNGACTTRKNGTNLTMDSGCLDISKTIEVDSTEYRKYTRKDLAWIDSTQNTWYTSGTIDIQLNDWTGTVTYTGAAVDPNYTMSNGSDEPLNGVLSMPTLAMKSKLKAFQKKTSQTFLRKPGR